MPARGTARCVALFAVFLAGPPLAAVPEQPPQVPGAIRSGITVVPIDVRVLDRNNRPVTDLQEEDFTIEEDGVRQQVRFFSAHALTEVAADRDARPTLRKAQDTSIAPQNQRTFLIVLGRGRLQHPSAGLDALIHFVRERLMPQDRVAVLAYNRATDFTLDHELVAKLLERFRGSNDLIDVKVREHLSGLRAIYGTQDLPAHIQADIDQVFFGPEGPPSRKLPPGRITDAGQIADDVQRSREAIQRVEDVQRAAAALQREEILEERPRPGLTEIIDEATMIDLSFDEYVFNYARTMTDLNNIYSGIEYLRYLDGEKHLLLVSESGLFLPRIENEQSIGSLASDARVVISAIHTGGTLPLRFLPPSNPLTAPAGRGSFNTATPPRLQTPWDDSFSIQSLETVARMTGGQAILAGYAERGLERIDETTRFQYLLGYSPTNMDWNGDFRRIQVRVNRPGVTVLFRRGYFGNRQLVPYDRRQFVTYSRIATAGHYTQPLPDIGVTIKRAAIDVQGDTRYAVADATIDISRVAFTMVDGRHTATLQVALFCGSGKDELVGELWQTIDLRLTAQTFQRTSSEGLVHTARVPLSGDPRYLKVIVYDYAADLVGSAVTRVR